MALSSSHIGSVSNCSLAELFQMELELCKAKSGERVIVFTDDEYNQKFVEAWCEAADRIGADCIDVGARFGPSIASVEESRLMQDVLKHADLLVQCLTDSWRLEYSDYHNDLLRKDVRSLVCIDDGERLRRMFPSDKNVIRRTVNAARLMRKAKTVRLTSEAGTDITMDKTGRKGSAEVGIADLPGKWDNMSAALASCAPLEDSANGVVVLKPGDVMRHLGRVVTEPVRLTFKDGGIVKFEGGVDARMLEDWLAQWRSEESYGTAHVGFGTDHRARWTTYLNMDWYCFLGSIHLDLGINIFDSPIEDCGLGGKNRAPSHMGLSMRDASYYLDRELLVEKGRFVHPELI